MPIRPLYDRVVVRLKDKSQTTESGIALVESLDQDQGEVVAVGDGWVLNDGTVHPLTVKIGDTVLLNMRAGSKIKVDGEELYVFGESELIGIINA